MSLDLTTKQILALTCIAAAPVGVEARELSPPSRCSPRTAREPDPQAQAHLDGASAIKCWWDDAKTLQCIKLHPK